MRLSKERREQLGGYAQAAVFLDGLVTIDNLVEAFNREEEEPTTFEEMHHGLRRFLATTPKSEISVEFAIYKDAYIANSELSKEQIEELIEEFENEGCSCGCSGYENKEATTAELIGLTAEIAAPLYGVLNFQELADILNHYHPQFHIVKDDILPGLTKHIEFSGEDVDYTIFEGFIVSPMILPDAIEMTDADVELIDNIRAEQKNHDRYLPDYEEFVRYATPIHEMMSDSFDRFLSFLDKNSKRLGIKEVGSLAITFLQLLKAGMEPNYFIEFFQEEGCSFSSTKFIDEFMGHAGEVYHHTRMYHLNGHTQSELELKVEDDLGIVTKVGRNEPCPCGSGKKFKKCCL